MASLEEAGRFRLKTEVGLLEVTTAATTASLVVSVVYNFGFFYKAEASFASLLTIQDFAISAAIALVPTGILLSILLGTSYSIGYAKGYADANTYYDANSSPEAKFRAARSLEAAERLDNFLESRAVAARIVLVGILLVVFVLMDVFPQSIFGYWLIFLALFVSSVLYAPLRSLVKGKSGWAFAYFLVVGLAIVFFFGAGVFDSAVRNARYEVAVAKTVSGETVAGKLIRVNSNYLFVHDGKGLRAWRLSELRAIGSSSH